jgi:hypothetical protein
VCTECAAVSADVEHAEVELVPEASLGAHFTLSKAADKSCQVVSALDSRQRDPSSNLSPAIYRPIRNNVGQDIYSHDVLRSTWPLILPKSINR